MKNTMPFVATNSGGLFVNMANNPYLCTCNQNRNTMDIIKIEIDGRTFRMFNLEIKGTMMYIAEENLDQFIQDCIEQDQYHKVKHIDEQYPFVVAQCIADLEDEEEIREEIEAIIDADGGVESFDWIFKYQA